MSVIVSCFVLHYHQRCLYCISLISSTSQPRTYVLRTWVPVQRGNIGNRSHRATERRCLPQPSTLPQPHDCTCFDVINHLFSCKSCYHNNSLASCNLHKQNSKTFTVISILVQKFERTLHSFRQTITSKKCTNTCSGFASLFSSFLFLSISLLQRQHTKYNITVLIVVNHR